MKKIKEKLLLGNIYLQDNEYEAMLIGFGNNMRNKMIYLHNGIVFMCTNLKKDGFKISSQFIERPTPEEIKNRMKLITKRSYI